MLMIEIYMLPGGDKSKKHLIGGGVISNKGSSKKESTGNYEFQLIKVKGRNGAKSSGVWKRGEIKGFPRLRLGPWDLLFRCLKTVLEGRNS